jgi:hypothetical protein
MLGSVEFVQSVTDNVHYQIWLLRMVYKKAKSGWSVD